MLNLGDLPCIFEWESGPYENYFTISPKRGTLAASTDIHFDVTFHP